MPTRIIACGMIAREVLAIIDQLGSDHLELTCLPAEYHFHPEKIAPEMEKAILKAHKEGITNIFAGYADCGTGGELDKICAKYGVKRVAGPHCFSFYIGNEEFDRTAEEYVTTFFVTDFLARQIDSFLIKPLGLDKHPELRDMYFGNYERLLYIAQTDDPQLSKNAQEAANMLGLKFERRYTGLGDLSPALAGI